MFKNSVYSVNNSELSNQRINNCLKIAYYLSITLSKVGYNRSNIICNDLKVISVDGSFFVATRPDIRYEILFCTSLLKHKLERQYLWN